MYHPSKKRVRTSNDEEEKREYGSNKDTEDVSNNTFYISKENENKIDGNTNIQDNAHHGNEFGGYPQISDYDTNSFRQKKSAVVMKDVTDHVHFTLSMNFHTMNELIGFVNFVLFCPRRETFACILALLDDTVHSYQDHPCPNAICFASSQIKETLRFIYTNFDSIQSKGQEKQGNIFIRGLYRSQSVFLNIALPLMTVTINEYFRTCDGIGFTLNPSIGDIRSVETKKLARLSRKEESQVLTQNSF